MIGCQRLRLSNVTTAEVPSTHASLGDQSFTVTEPQLRNNLPLNLLDSELTLPECHHPHNFVTLRTPFPLSLSLSPHYFRYHCPYPHHIVFVVISATHAQILCSYVFSTDRNSCMVHGRVQQSHKQCGSKE